jgi:hypothetical protein
MVTAQEEGERRHMGRRQTEVLSVLGGLHPHEKWHL